MKKIIYIFFILLSLGKLSAQTAADSSFVPQYKTGTIYTINTNIGTQHRGFVVKESKDDILLESKNSHDTLRISKASILSSKQVSKDRKAEPAQTFEEEYQASSYIVSSSAFLFDENTSTSTAHWFLVENIDYAFTENFALTANTLVFYPFSIGLKCAFKIDEMNYIGGNILAMGNLFASASSASFIGYGGFAKYTHGTQDKNITVSAGVLGLNSDVLPMPISTPFLNMGFLNLAYGRRFTEHLAFNAEGWYFPESQGGIGGVGLKVINGESFCWNFGCYTFLESSYKSAIKVDLKSIPIPYIGYVRKFD